ncbi:MAG: hypothetical protein ACLUOO_13315 [Coprococcus sp.]|jgi:uncharacterized protein (DUF1015 family)
MVEVTNEVIQEIEDNISEEVSEYFFENDIFSAEEIADVLVVVMDQLDYDDVSEILNELDSELLSADNGDTSVATPIMDALAQADRG